MFIYQEKFIVSLLHCHAKDAETQKRWLDALRAAVAQSCLSNLASGAGEHNFLVQIHDSTVHMEHNSFPCIT